MSDVLLTVLNKKQNRDPVLNSYAQIKPTFQPFCGKAMMLLELCPNTIHLLCSMSAFLSETAPQLLHILQSTTCAEHSSP